MSSEKQQSATLVPVVAGSPADLEDERLLNAGGLRGAVAMFGRRVRAGDLGSLPVIIGLVVIWAAFEIISGGIFLQPDNLVNLAAQSAGTGLISVGIVFVLLLGEIDLSVGSVSGLSASILGIGLTTLNWPFWSIVLFSLGIGALIGVLYGFLFTRFGVPSFVVTLAGLLAFEGIQLLVLNTNGSINLQSNSFIVQFSAFAFLAPWQGYLLAVIAAAAVLASDLRRASKRRKAGLSTSARSLTFIKAGVILVGLAVVEWYLSQDRGTSVSFLFLVLVVIVMNFLVTRTRWGRSIYAVGGNEEAARRSGINVRLVYVSVFIVTACFAVLGGMLSAGYLTAVTLSAGTGDVNLNAIAAAVIGGTSLFGGRGNVWSALLGTVVITSIANGLSLVNFTGDAPRFIVTGVVLLLAVIVDSLSRRSRASHGAA